MPDDHSELVPLLPIPNRTVKRLCADDSADSRVKVGHRQAIKPENAPVKIGAFFFVLVLSIQVLLQFNFTLGEITIEQLINPK